MVSLLEITDAAEYECSIAALTEVTSTAALCADC